MLDKALMDILACPKCKGDVEYNNRKNGLLCPACQLEYPIRDDIPVMLIDEAKDLSA
ncbi:MAG: Trm112 family protein [Mariprofundus sp.]|nr:Trm112 family protein [Mariprofundus sp.]